MALKAELNAPPELLRDDIPLDTKDGLSSPIARSLADEITWTPEQEKELVRKLDFLIMPLLIVVFFALQMDRGNIGNALTDHFFEDVGITQEQFNIGQQLLSLGIVILEIPSNFVLYRIGPSVWISFQVLAWGMVATFQAFQKGVGAFMVTRLLLGLCESGFIPAGFFTITRWYKRSESSKRFSWYFIGNLTASACSGLIAYGILHMDGVAGLAGWQWLFIIEGLFTIVAGIIFMTLFPLSPGNPVSLTRVRYFTEEEAHILQQRVLIDDPSKHYRSRNITREEFVRTFSNWRLYPHVILTLAGLSPASTLSSYGPTLVKGFGYGHLVANAMWSIAGWVQLVLCILWGTIADKIGMRGPVVLAGGVIWWIFAICCRCLVYSKNEHLRFGILIIAFGFNQIWHPVNGSWMALNARSAGERSILMACLIMSANAAGIIGSQLFQSSDKPYYPIGWTAIVILVSIALIAMVVANLQYLIGNRKLERMGSSFRWHQ